MCVGGGGGGGGAYSDGGATGAIVDRPHPHCGIGRGCQGHILPERGKGERERGREGGEWERGMEEA